MRCARLMIAMVLPIALFAAPAAAAPAVGDKAPEINATDWLNAKGTVSLAKLQGQIAVVEFWATWCPPCRASIPHLVELHNKWKDKHVVVIGLSDESKSKIEPFAKEQGMSYIVGCGSSSASAYGVTGIPQAFIITPDGKIAWAGHPMSGMDRALEQIYEKNPPTGLSDKDLKAIKTSLDKAAEAVKAEKYAAAIKLLNQANEALPKDHELHEQADKLLGKVTEAGAKALAAADKLHKDDKIAESLAAYRRVVVDFAGTEPGSKAAEKVSAMQKDPAVSKLLEQQRRDALATSLFNRAESLWKSKKVLPAYEAYQDAAKLDDTDAGAQAAKKIKEIDADKKVSKQIRDELAKKKCPGWLSMARSYTKIKKPEKAREYYQRVIDEFGDSSYAATAKKDLAALPEPKKD